LLLSKGFAIAAVAGQPLATIIIMKTRLILVIFLLIGLSAYPQSEIKGEYCRLAEGVISNIKEYDKCLTFHSGNKFEYFNKYDYYGPGVGEYGSGIYYIFEDTLSLVFARVETKKNNFNHCCPVKL
jgi:hypothetical protein